MSVILAGCYHPPMLVTLSQVRSAIANDALTACFQPIVELRSGRIIGFEVLARWDHPEGGLTLPPGCRLNCLCR